MFSEFGDVVATSESLEVEDAVAFDDSVAAIRRHLDDGTSNETIFEVCPPPPVSCGLPSQGGEKACLRRSSKRIKVIW